MWLNVVNYFFIISANLICRGTDISKYFREAIRIRDNESRLYIHTYIRTYVRTYAFILTVRKVFFCTGSVIVSPTCSEF